MVKPVPYLPSDLPVNLPPSQHGVRRVKQSAEALALKREKEHDKLRAYLELEGRVLDLVSPSISIFAFPILC
jgi:hypothetical protein